MINELCVNCDGRGFVAAPADVCSKCGGYGERPAWTPAAIVWAIVSAIGAVAIWVIVK